MQVFHDRMLQENGFVCRDSICRLCGDRSYVPRVQPLDGATAEDAIALLEECGRAIGSARIVGFPKGPTDEIIARCRVGGGEARIAYWYHWDSMDRYAAISREDAAARLTHRLAERAARA